METFTVYILYSPSADKYYVGQTHDLEIRLKMHNELSLNSFTSKFRPWILKRSIDVESRAKAIKMEQFIKKKKSRKYIEALINNDWVVEKLLISVG